VPAGSVEALEAGMEQLLACPIGEIERMGNAAHKRVLARHSIDLEAAKLAALFAGATL
jgi:hypothetical protein